MAAYIDEEDRSDMEQAWGQTREGARLRVRAALSAQGRHACVGDRVHHAPAGCGKGTTRAALGWSRTSPRASTPRSNLAARWPASPRCATSTWPSPPASICASPWNSFWSRWCARWAWTPPPCWCATQHLQTLDFTAGRGFRATSVSRLRLRMGEGHAGRAALERRIITVSDLAHGAIGPGRSRRRRGVRGHGRRAADRQGRGAGRARPASPRHAFVPDPEWLDFLEALAQQVAIAIDNSPPLRRAAALHDGTGRGLRRHHRRAGPARSTCATRRPRAIASGSPR